MPRQTGAFEMVLTLWPLLQTFTYTHAHRAKIHLIHVFEQVWYPAETLEEALDRSRQKRKHDTGEKYCFLPRNQNISHTFLLPRFVSLRTTYR